MDSIAAPHLKQEKSRDKFWLARKRFEGILWWSRSQRKSFIFFGSWRHQTQVSFLTKAVVGDRALVNPCRQIWTRILHHKSHSKWQHQQLDHSKNTLQLILQQGWDRGSQNIAVAINIVEKVFNLKHRILDMNIIQLRAHNPVRRLSIIPNRHISLANSYAKSWTQNRRDLFNWSPNIRTICIILLPENRIMSQILRFQQIHP